MRAVLISPYELGRQPFALAHLAAVLEAAGVHTRCVDLAQQRLVEAPLADADLIVLSLGMHTATRIAVEALPRIRERAPDAWLCAFGLYAPVNEGLLRSLGVGSVFGGESEPDLVAVAQALGAGVRPAAGGVRRSGVRFMVPMRSGLPPLARYAHLVLPDGTTRQAGFAEASRGCKHLCRHCPVVPVYQGRFRAVPVDVVLADVAQQVAAGAKHISFGDPDFLNGPTHALRVVRALHTRFPALSYDATIKVEHLLAHRALLPELRATGCLFITTAAESVEDAVLERLAKGHTQADLETAVRLTRAAGIATAPTFVPFTPWSTLAGYRQLLHTLLALGLVHSVPPVQLSIRLLVPAGSYLLDLPGFAEMLQPFDPATLGYPWRHRDPRVDALQAEVQRLAAAGEAEGRPRGEIFADIWRAAHAALGEPAPTLDPARFGPLIPRLSEPWYCCAEPTEQQLQSI
ncbi:radical SAM protein [Ectothiorhodospiraceae bacterium 2226]|nr:radical SAM protein [Ectothiorhodospiraceae bacterium 2226]